MISLFIYSSGRLVSILVLGFTALPLITLILYFERLLPTSSEGTTFLKYKIPTRGLLGLRNAILTASRGTAILNTIFDSYGPWAGDMSTRDLGSLVSSNFLSRFQLLQGSI